MLDASGLDAVGAPVTQAFDFGRLNSFIDATEGIAPRVAAASRRTGLHLRGARWSGDDRPVDWCTRTMTAMEPIRRPGENPPPAQETRLPLLPHLVMVIWAAVAVSIMSALLHWAVFGYDDHLHDPTGGTPGPWLVVPVALVAGAIAFLPVAFTWGALVISQLVWRSRPRLHLIVALAGPPFITLAVYLRFVSQ